MPHNPHDPWFFTMMSRGRTTCSISNWFIRRLAANSSNPFGFRMNFHTVRCLVSRMFNKSR